MSKQWNIKYAECEIYEDSYSEGENIRSVNSFSIHTKKIYKDLESLQKDIASFFGYNSKDVELFALDGRITTSLLVTIDNDKPSQREIQEWKAGDLLLFSAHIDVGLTVIEGEREPTDEDFIEEGITIY